MSGHIEGTPYGTAKRKIDRGFNRNLVYNASSFAEVIDAAIDEIFKDNDAVF